MDFFGPISGTVATHLVKNTTGLFGIHTSGTEAPPFFSSTPRFFRMERGYEKEMETFFEANPGFKSRRLRSLKIGPSAEVVRGGVAGAWRGRCFSSRLLGVKTN